MKIDNKFKEQILSDIRAEAFKKAVRFINYELVPGDICEFGCYTGRSLASLTYCHQKYFQDENKHNQKSSIQRKVYGFDSFEGLQDSEGHPRWEKGVFKLNHSFHPLIGYGEEITPEKIVNFFSHYNLQTPIIKPGYFKEIEINDIDKIALLHVDCDLYTSTKTVLNLVRTKLSPGSIILFDDWFHFKGNKNKGERLAFKEFLEENKNIKCEEFLRYGTFCKSFIINET